MTEKPETTATISACPFCGGDATVGTVTYQEGSMVARANGRCLFFFVSCAWCGSSNQGLVGKASQDEAVIHWNRRSRPRSKDEMLAQWR